MEEERGSLTALMDMTQWYCYLFQIYNKIKFENNNKNATYHVNPSKILLASEGCSCPDVKINNWLRAERYNNRWNSYKKKYYYFYYNNNRLAHDVIFDLQNYAQGNKYL